MDASVRMPYFFVEDDGSDSFVDVEAGFSGNQYSQYPHLFFLRPRICHGGAHPCGGSRNISISCSSISPRFCRGRFEDHSYRFLEACFLCKKALNDDKDIFMYRGDTPFCSEECRQKQIDMDEAKEHKMNLSSSIKAMRNLDQSTSTDKSITNHDCCFLVGTVVAA
ncbi:uncharacterized protein LOC111491063 [Cucurbita maxima]|uniref:Uncharacterized protein LOC111491063 n=1 Tax=Cucurbita maxima TaxID=3661 RepID=A0A6J1K8C4_CUCMA|nr:uncharacterized protein LOC111491063 [Cucurbita maxima]